MPSNFKPFFSNSLEASAEITQYCVRESIKSSLSHLCINSWQCTDPSKGRRSAAFLYRHGYPPSFVRHIKVWSQTFLYTCTDMINTFSCCLMMQRVFKMNQPLYWFYRISTKWIKKAMLPLGNVGTLWQYHSNKSNNTVEYISCNVVKKPNKPGCLE